ncbi:MAG: hypothetical protein DKM50_13495 [Candidatus Margulisiibacteriota bacterium]|nr:MAG: hypothetical protein A2X43_10645 [Candidatus Margulisbacteria bacterium GWD2_39_127]OGI04461.1 MAG: hypothetical protein A2X42_04120 [Candidatus Margulisbacteria bacterium GWF2_38_17]OGI07171.1 MAG: hypothetical protein A2X41_06190 [Candidatus Margulisbacteria bacterium GWE2_39_32]PZM77264.1 MAG: hypothetical protein DKM50_13495 [Candidatus Margulisiibacteriota bacterium]HAR64388.1 hypothetical protein [Candidatus Margulisiibacteriota bacterium]
MKINCMVLALLITFISATSSQALITINGIYSNYVNNKGFGAGTEFRISDTYSVRVLISKLEETTIKAAVFSFAGQNFGEDTFKVSSYALEGQVFTNESLFGFRFGLAGFVDLLYGKDSSGNLIGLPANAYIGAFVNNKQDILPFLQGYGEAGYLVRVVNGEKEFNSRIKPASVDLGDIDKSGFYSRLGVSISI